MHTWTIRKRMEKNLEGNYIIMLRAILNKSRRQHPAKQQLYGYLPPITKVNRTGHARHCCRRKGKLISDTLQWTPSHGRAKAERPAWNYIQHLGADAGCCLEDLPGAWTIGRVAREGQRDPCWQRDMMMMTIMHIAPIGKLIFLVTCKMYDTFLNDVIHADFNPLTLHWDIIYKILNCIFFIIIFDIYLSRLFFTNY